MNQIKQFFLKSQVLLLLLVFSCSNPSIDGTWKLRRHDYYDLEKNIGLQETDKPFEVWEITEGNLLIDGIEEFYALKNDTITITFESKFRHFIIHNLSETSLLLKSPDLTPGTYSFYYFFK